MASDRSAETANLAAPYVSDYVAAYEALAADSADEPGFLSALRREAIDAFAAGGIPTTRDEEWRFTNLAPVAGQSFRVASTAGTVDGDALAPHLYDSAHHLVFVDGHYSPEMSSVGSLPDGVIVDSIGDAVRTHASLVEPWLGRHADFAKQPFVALNTALMRDGAFVYVPKGVVLDTPIHLVFVATGGGAPTINLPRNLLVVGEHAQATVVETYLGTTDDTYFTCGVTEVAAAQASVFDHYKVQQETLSGYHLASLQIVQDRDSNFSTHSISTGGELVRYDVNAFLDGEGVECTLNGLYVARGKQHVDHHMWVEHAKPHGDSRELFKGILDDEAKAVFNGRIFVHQEAQTTDAKQSNRNLLLSDKAHAHSNPQLEIFADDVKCTHGSTVGELDEDATFYLRSRGIGEDAARSILIYAFAGDIVGGIKLDDVRTRLEEHLYATLPHGEVVRQTA